MLVPWLAKVDEDELDELISHARLIHLNDKQALLGGQQQTRHLAVIADGKIEASVSNKEGKRHVLGVLGRGHVFGFISLFDSNPHFYGLTALGSATLISIPQDVLLDSMQRSRILLVGLMETLSQRAHQAYRALADQHLLSPQARLARYLTKVVNQYGGPIKSNQYQIIIELSQAAIADVIGISRQKLSLELKILERKGLIQLQYSKIVLLDMVALEALVTAEI